ncbi:MAG: MAPEG family protein [Proteobacteria bacterium]|nr:MAPEG family protein [Pseudomonadota bacterium]
MAAISLSIVPLYAAVLGILYLALTFAVIRNRYRLRVSLGDGGDERLNRVIRGHGNFAEYVPLSLLLLAFAEIGGTEALVIHLGSLALLTGRLLHGYALALTLRNMLARRYGMILTLASIVIGIGACLRLSLGA